MTYVRIQDGRVCTVEGLWLRPIGRPCPDSPKGARCKALTMQPYVVVYSTPMHIPLAA